MSGMKLIMENWRRFQEQEEEERPTIQTVGELRKFFRNMKIKKAGGAAAKKLGKWGLSFLGPVGKAIETGWDAAGDVGGGEIGALMALYGLGDQVKSNTGLDKLNIDDNISKIIDNPVEITFLKWFVEKLNKESPTKLLADYDMQKEMEEFLAGRFGGHAVKK